MMNKKKRTINGCLLMIMASVLLMPYLSSCGKSGNASSVGLNVQFEVVNLSPNILPVNLYLNYIKQNTNSYSYPLSSGYFFLNSIDTPLQIRSASTILANNNFFTINHLGFQANHKYSLFITGSYNATDTAANTITPILTQDDTASIPPVGFGKIRFVNGAIINPGTALDVTANSSIAFSGIKFAKISPYVLLPAGNYIFKMNATGAPATTFNTNLGTTTIQDGRLYTLYCYGVPLRTDSAAFNAGVIINR